MKEEKKKKETKERDNEHSSHQLLLLSPRDWRPYMQVWDWFMWAARGRVTSSLSETQR